jgi:hypothetical protein
LSYLQPPPSPAPVVVVKDVGGYVNEYAAQTEVYRQTNREVRLHECRSACTMALSLPNVCVYPDSILKFHQAYDPRNHAANLNVSQQLFETYPPAVRARLGTLTRDYHVLRGSELIALGVRDCNTPPGPRIMVASAAPKPLPEGNGAGGFGWSSLTGKLEGMASVINKPSAPPPPTQGRPDEKPPVSSELLMTRIPLPPTRPAGLVTAKIEPPTTVAVPTGTPSAVPSSAPAEPAPIQGVPLPPKKPPMLVAYTPSLRPIPFMQRIAGSQPILPAKFIPFEKRKT